MKFYRSVESMRSYPPPYADPFILQWEIPQPKDGVERKYIAFDGITEYLRLHMCRRYTTCHEVFIAQSFNVDDDVYGHPAFDLDMKVPKEGTIPRTVEELHEVVGLPSYWQEMLQEDITSILCKQYPAHEEEILRVLSNSRNKDVDGINPWVWMSSPSLEKVSKHLVIGRVCFSMWRIQMKLLVKELLTLDRPYTSAIDEGILRKLGSLRLPLNHKRHKYEMTDDSPLPILVKESPLLTFDDARHRFSDGVVLIHDANMHTMKEGIILTPSDLSPEYQHQLSQVYGIYQIPSMEIVDDEQEQSSDDLISAFNRLDKLYKTGLKAGKVSGRYLHLVRRMPGKCPISGKVHEGDGAYMYKGRGKILFGCHRGCIVKINGEERKHIEVTPAPPRTAEDIARLCNEDMNRQNRDNEE